MVKKPKLAKLKLKLPKLKFKLPKLKRPKLKKISIKNLWPTIKRFIKEYWYVLIVVLVIFIPLYIFIFQNLPSPTRLKSGKDFPTSTKIMDRNGKLLFEVYADKNRTPVPIDELPQHLLQATIAIEDKNFYRHHGLDTQGIVRAAFSTLFKKKLQGGSTITQQLVKTTLLTPERTLQRKIKEAILSIATEIIYTKKQILQMYLNYTPYGGIAYGVEAASQLYFDKSARDLNLAEAALLAGLPQAPTRYSPFGSNPENALLRQKEVLRRMHEEEYIDEDQRQDAQNQEIEFATNKIEIKAPHFALFVKDILVEKFGTETVEQGGLKVTTTLDLDLQEYAQASLSAEINQLARLKVSNGAALITKPFSGEILSMVGSKDYFDTASDGQVNVTLSYRQPGSSIKPINYSGLLAKDFNASTMVLDVPTCFISVGQPLYCPKNYDNSFHGPVLFRDALANSYNIPAVKYLTLNTVEDMIATASAMGITGWDDPSKYGLSLTLGGGEVRMVDMAVAFGTFANSGIKVPLQPILKIEDQQGKILQEYKPPEDELPVGDQAIPSEIAYLISHILSDNQARTPAFGGFSELVIPKQIVSAKTGTTNDLRDNWTIGYTPKYLAVTWVGNNDNTPMSYLTSGVTGAAPIWNNLMSHLLDGQTAVWPSKPENIVTHQICTNTGLIPHPDAPCSTKTEYFIKGHEPKSNYPTTRGIWINKDTNLPAFMSDTPPEDVNTDNLELREHTVLSDAFTKDFCLSCPWPQETNEDGTPKEDGKIHYPEQKIDMSRFYGIPQDFQLPTPPPPQP